MHRGRSTSWLSVAACGGGLLAGLLGCAAGPVPRDRPTDHDVVVIGAGMGGLSAAAHLAAGGLSVLVLEQNHKVGGCTSAFERGDYRFDVSLHEMAGGGAGGLVAELLEAAGVRPKVDLIAIPRLYRTIVRTGSGPAELDFSCPAGVDQARAAFAERWPAESAAIDDFFAEMAEVYDDLNELRPVFRSGPVGAAFTLLLVPFRQRALFRNHDRTLGELLDERFQDERLKLALGQYWFFYGPPPSRLWAPMFMLATYSYLKDGAWHVRGSSQALADAYAARVTELGGQVRTGVEVAGILVEDERALGVVTAEGERIAARYVVSSADPYQTFFRLVGEEHAPQATLQRIRELEPSNSFAGVYLGLDVEPEFFGVADHEIFLNTSFDADRMHRNMMAGRHAEGCLSLTFYGNLGDAFYAPPGGSVLVLHSYSSAAAWPRERAAYAAARERMADELIDLAATLLPDLRAHIRVRETITPLAIEAFTMQKDGVPYGFEFTPEQWQRLPNETAIDGLYLAGAWARPSHGVAGTQISGYQAARLILDREGID